LLRRPPKRSLSQSEVSGSIFGHLSKWAAATPPILVQQMIRPLLDAEPVVRTFNVDSSTTHKIVAEKAA
jgi:hypothetical protein